MLVRIDVRENKLITLLENMLLEKSLKIEIQKEQLAIGDIILEHKGNKLVIERKSVNDLAYSISDGRYMEQSFRLDKSEYHNHNIIYLIEGDIRNFKETSRINKKALYSSLLSLNSYKGFSVMRTYDLEETANLILFFSEKMLKNEKNSFYYSDNSGNVQNIEDDKHYVDVLCNSKKSNITKENIGEIILSQIPSVSKAIAKRIMGQYKTIRDLISVLEEDPEVLKDIKIKDNNGKERKVNSTAIKNIKEYLVLNKS
tara:strand:+ start:4897 stop:5667 length:771 start_codon:yes stop_codon:yes gene_type:complete